MADDYERAMAVVRGLVTFLVTEGDVPDDYRPNIELLYDEPDLLWLAVGGAVGIIRNLVELLAEVEGLTPAGTWQAYLRAGEKTRAERSR